MTSVKRDKNVYLSRFLREETIAELCEGLKIKIPVCY